MLFHQLPALSPLPFSALARGARTLFPGVEDPHELLLRVLLDRTGAGAGRLTDSGTSALRLALDLLAAEGQIPVALPAFSCYDVASAAVGAAVPVIPYDLDPGRLSPDPDSLKAAFSAGAQSVVIAPLCGFPVDWDIIRDLTKAQGVTVVEDAAQAHGSTFQGRPSGSHGDLVVLSFGRGKGWTGGGGGALLIRSPEWTKPLELVPPAPARGLSRDLRHLAGTTAMWFLARPAVYGVPHSIPALALGQTLYREPLPVERMGRAAAAVAFATKEASDREVAVRKAAAREYVAHLEEVDPGSGLIQRVTTTGKGESGYLRFPVLVKGTEGPAEPSMPPRARRLGAERSYPGPLTELPALQHLLAIDIPTPPGAKELSRSLITLPTHSRTRTSERLELVKTLAQLSPATHRPRSVE